MRISYRNKLFDIIAFNLYHLARSPIMIGVGVLALSFNCWMSWQGFSESTSLLVRLIVSTIFQFAFDVILAVVLLGVIILGNISKMNKTVLTDFSITISPDSFISDSQFSHSELKWSAVQKLSRTRSYIFMYVTQHGAIVIPRRAFTTQETWDQFWLACQSGVNPA